MHEVVRAVLPSHGQSHARDVFDRPRDDDAERHVVRVRLLHAQMVIATTSSLLTDAVAPRVQVRPARLRDALHADLRDDATARKSVSASRAFTLLTSSAKTAAVQPVTTDRTRCTKVEDASGIPRPDPQREKKEQALRSKKSTDDESPGEHQPVPTTQKGRQSGEGEGGPPTGSCEKA